MLESQPLIRLLLSDMYSQKTWYRAEKDFNFEIKRDLNCSSYQESANCREHD